MAIQPIVLSPTTGLLDTTTYPNPPVGPAAGDARHQIQGVIDQIVTAVNANIKDVLNSDTDGASGGDNVAMTPITGLAGATVQTIMESLKTALDDAIMGAIPDASLADIKLAADIKVGSLADLDTTDKDSVTDAINEVVGTVGTHLADTVYQAAGGTGTAITLTISGTLVEGYPITFIASAGNSGAATTINTKPLYKPGGTAAPTLIAGKAYSVWFSQSGDCFFIKASAEGNAVAADVLAGKTFSNDNDTGLTGLMDLSDLIATNIKSGVTINGITGSVEPLSLTAGDYPIADEPTDYNMSSNIYTRIGRRMTCHRAGTVRLIMQIGATDGAIAYAKIYKNGSAVGTERVTSVGQTVSYSEDFSCQANDYFDVYIRSASNGNNVYLKNYTASGSFAQLVTLSSV